MSELCIESEDEPEEKIYRQEKLFVYEDFDALEQLHIYI